MIAVERQWSSKATSLGVAVALHGALVGMMVILPGLATTKPIAVGSFEMVDLPSFGAAPPEPPAPPEDSVPEREEPVPEPEPPPEAVVEPEPEPIVEPEPEPEVAEIQPEAPPPVHAPLIPKPVSKPKPPEPEVVKPKPIERPVATRQPVPVEHRPEAVKTPTDAPLSPGGAEAYVPPDSHSAYLRNPKPAYPLAARKRNMEGLVLLIVEVSADGRPSNVKIKQSSRHSVLDNAAVQAVSRWRFVPATRFGKSVRATIEVPINFQLKR